MRVERRHDVKLKTRAKLSKLKWLSLYLTSGASRKAPGPQTPSSALKEPSFNSHLDTQW